MQSIIDCRESFKNKVRSCSCRWNDPFAKLFLKFKTFDLCLNIRIYLFLEILVFFLISVISFLNSYIPNRIRFCSLYEGCFLSLQGTFESIMKIILRILFFKLVDLSVLLFYSRIQTILFRKQTMPYFLRSFRYVILVIVVIKSYLKDIN